MIFVCFTFYRETFSLALWFCISSLFPLQWIGFAVFILFYFCSDSLLLLISSFLEKIFIYFELIYFECVCLLVWMCMSCACHVCRCLWSLEEGVGYSGTGVTVNCQLLYRCWEPNLVLLWEQQVLLITKLSLQPSN